MSCSSAWAAFLPFTPGDIVVTRAVGGDVDTTGGAGSTGVITTSTALAGSGVAASVFVDEYTPTGTFVESLQLPNVVNNSGTGNRALTFSGTQNTEGAITLSGDGRYFVVAGYNATAVSSTASPNFQGTNGVAATVTPRVVGLIDMNGNVNTTTALTDVSSTLAFRSAYSSDGTNIWTSGGGGGSSGTTAGIHYTTVGSTTSVQLTAGSTNHRVLNFFNGSLYLSNNAAGAGGAAVRGPDQMTGGLATSGTQTLTQLTGFGAATTPTPLNETADDFWFKNATTLYVADERNDGVNGGLQKWVFTDTDSDGNPDTWVFQYNVPLPKGTAATNVGAHGLAGTVDPISGNADLYVTSFDSAGADANSVYSLVDTGTQAGMAASLTALATSATNSAFRGVEIVPGTIVPEPATLSLIGIAGLGLLRRRSKV